MATPFNYLADIDVLSPEIAWGAGAGLAKYEHGYWAVVDYGEDDRFVALEMLDEEHGWALGTRPASEPDGDGMATIYRIEDHRAIPSETYPNLGWVDLDSTTSGELWAIGVRASFGEAIFHYDGERWSEVSPHLELDGTVVAIDMLSDSIGWIALSSGIILRWDGHSWMVEHAGDLPGFSKLYDLVAVSEDDVWAVGGVSALAIGNRQLVLHYDGKTWRTVIDTDASPLLRVDMASATSGWAVGDNRSIYRYDGVEWKLLGFAVDAPFTEPVAVKHIPGTNDAWAAQYGGSVYRLHHDRFDRLQPSGSYNSIAFVSPDRGWILGNTLLEFDRSAGGWIDKGRVNDIGSFRDLAVINKDNVWFVGGRKSESGDECYIAHLEGLGWEFFESPGSVCHTRVSFTERTDGWAAGYREVFDPATRRFDYYESSVIHFDGEQWREVHSARDVRFFGISAASSNDVWVVDLPPGRWTPRIGRIDRIKKGWTHGQELLEAVQAGGVGPLRSRRDDRGRRSARPGHRHGSNRPEPRLTK